MLPLKVDDLATMVLLRWNIPPPAEQAGECCTVVKAIEGCLG